MPEVRPQDAVLQALQTEDSAEVRALLDDFRPEDLADALVRVSDDDDKIAILQKVDEDTAAHILVELPTEEARRLLARLDDTVVAWYLDILPMDDAIDLLEELGEERFTRLLHMIPDEDAREIRRLLRYPEGSVGRLMTERFFEATERQTMDSLLVDLRNVYRASEAARHGLHYTGVGVPSGASAADKRA